MVTDTRAKSLLKAIELIEVLQDAIAFDTCSEGGDWNRVTPEKVLEELQKIHVLIDRSYPEDVHDDRFQQRELDFNTDTPFAEGGLDYDPEEEEER